MKRRIIWAVAAVAVLVVGFSGPAKAAAISSLYNTGIDVGGGLISNGVVGDPHYTLTSVPLGSTTDILIRTSAGGFPIGPYLADDLLSRWIGPNNDSQFNSPGGAQGDSAFDYTYRTTFDLTGFNPLTAAITGGWSTDNNGVDILINGASLGFTTTFSQFSDSFSPFSISSGFAAGINTIDFIVHNGQVPGGGSENNPTALRVEMTGTADLNPSAVPEPASLIVFGAFGALSFFGYGWKRRQQAA